MIATLQYKLHIRYNILSLCVVYNITGVIDTMYNEEFQNRLIQLRTKKGVSARDMSLSIGQNASYIHHIENGKALPSMGVFFYICDYLGITPSEFFDLGTENPSKLKPIIEKMKKLDDEQLSGIDAVVTGMIRR